MSAETNIKSTAGRKPLGEAAMSATERKRRSRQLQEAAGCKTFQLQVQGAHLQFVEALASTQGISASAALRHILEPALDRYVGVVRRCEAMQANGATEADIAKFLQTYWMPVLPIMP